MSSAVEGTIFLLQWREACRHIWICQHFSWKNYSAYQESSICCDCHSTIKFISKSVDGEIDLKEHSKSPTLLLKIIQKPLFESNKREERVRQPHIDISINL